LSILLAVSSDGKIYFKFLDGINNEMIVASFMRELSFELDKDYENWRSNHILVLDNCSSHKTLKMREILGSGHLGKAEQFLCCFK
jgi:hypothetical protein